MTAPAKHTPGPWIAIRSAIRWHGSDPIFKDGLWHILPEGDPERLPIATVDKADDHHAPTRAQAEDDAALIAATPELLDAAKPFAAADNVTSGAESDPEAPDAEPIYIRITLAELRALREAIAKAEPRS